MKKRNYRRVSTRVHTRKLDRGVARKFTKDVGMHKVTKNGFFAKNWRELTKEAK